MTGKDVSAMLRADADAAVAGGVGSRRPCSCLPANPTQDHRVAYALESLRHAARGAFEEGATESEVESVCLAARWSALR